MVIAVDKARDPIDASVSLPEGSAFFQAQPAVDGRTIDVDATLAAIDPRLAATDAGGASVAAVTQPVEPALTTAEAEAAAIRASQLTAADIAVTSGKKHFTISNDSLRSWVTFQAGPDGALVAAFDAKKLQKAVKGFAKKVDQAGTQCRFRMSRGRAGRPTSIIASKPGRATDVAASVAAIQASLASPPADGLPTAELVVSSSQPDFTTEDAKAWKGKLKPIGRARWTTHFPQGDHNFNGQNIFIRPG
jgi:hypothetical protein